MEARTSSEITMDSPELRSAPKERGYKVDKVEVLGKAIGIFPYLIRKSAGRQRVNTLMSKYILRPLDLDRLEYVIGEVASPIGS